ncbi:MAG: pantoate--beta-alanine ligase [Elusimicrobia bacterium]|nr:pantoate--beta-alanine ligase [Candidatus Liberimonas magnetica]
MKIIKSAGEMQKIALRVRQKGKSVGLVPTMGALHEGHASLVKKARKENEIVVVSIFVNPIQFGPNEDYLRYPRPFSKDKKICKSLKVDYIFAPEVKDMYPGGQLAHISVSRVSEVLCGPLRPGHFKGVATVVAKLFNIILPVKAYFGAKDYQQLKIIEKMACDLNFPVKIIACPILREKDGLAMSSRNQYLTKTERENSLNIHRSLKLGEKLIKSKKIRNSKDVLNKIIPEIKKIPGSKIDYIRIVHPETLEYISKIKLPIVIAAAVWIGKTRLIDNIKVSNKL